MYADRHARSESLIYPERQAENMDERMETVVGLTGAAILVLGGTLATGYLPSEPRSQLLAGGIIVAGFALGFYVLGEFELPD